MKTFLQTFLALFFTLFAGISELKAQIQVVNTILGTVKRNYQLRCDSNKVVATLTFDNMQLTQADTLIVTWQFSHAIAASKVNTIIFIGQTNIIQQRRISFEEFFPQNGVYTLNYSIRRLNDNLLVTGSFPRTAVINHRHCLRHEVILAFDRNGNC